MSETVTDPPDVELPPYVRPHWSESEQKVFFRFEASTKMRREGFPLRSLPLGTDLPVALARYDAEVAPLLKARREKTLTVSIENGPGYGTLAWAAEIYQTTQRFKNLAEITKGGYLRSISRCCKYQMQTGPFAGQYFGNIPMQQITPALVDDFYDEYLFVRESDEQGNVVMRKRSRVARDDINTLRAMVNAIKRKHGHLLYKGSNPFEGVYMPHVAKGPVAVNLAQLATFVHTADKLDLSSVSAIALFAWEMQARVSHYPYQMDVADYRGKFHEEEVLVRAEKVRDERYFLLYDDDGKPLYPALMQRLDALKGERASGPLFVCEDSPTNEPTPWTMPRLYAAVAEICNAAGLPPLTLTQFRKGGLTESGSAGLTTTQIMSQSIHKLEQTVQIYIEKNQEVAMQGQKRRLRWRRKKAKRGIDIVT